MLPRRDGPAKPPGSQALEPDQAPATIFVAARVAERAAGDENRNPAENTITQAVDFAALTAAAQLPTGPLVVDDNDALTIAANPFEEVTRRHVSVSRFDSTQVLHEPPVVPGRPAQRFARAQTLPHAGLPPVVRSLLEPESTVTRLLDPSLLPPASGRPAAGAGIATPMAMAAATPRGQVYLRTPVPFSYPVPSSPPPRPGRKLGSRVVVACAVGTVLLLSGLAVSAFGQTYPQPTAAASRVAEPAAAGPPPAADPLPEPRLPAPPRIVGSAAAAPSSSAHRSHRFARPGRVAPHREP